MKIYIVRHGAVFEEGADKRFLGITDVPMTAAGRQQVQKTAALLTNEVSAGRKMLVTSPLARCRETAKILQAAMPFADVQEEPLLREIDLGDWEMQTHAQIRAMFPEAYRKRGEKILTYRTPGGEPFQEAGRRFQEAFGRWTDAAAEKDIEELFLISHRGTVLSGLAEILGTPAEEMLVERFPYGGAIQTDRCGRVKQVFFPEGGNQ